MHPGRDADEHRSQAIREGSHALLHKTACKGLHGRLGRFSLFIFARIRRILNEGRLHGSHSMGELPQGESKYHGENSCKFSVSGSHRPGDLGGGRVFLSSRR